ncbi:MAG: helix-turn-helix domain-containing protein [Candidatus Adiutrix sp.]|jgi:DNA-binding transcriptional regulator YiaG|nr:helix-turn-helix domain-containing protein [Candidatus Adiutrix sp.]
MEFIETDSFYEIVTECLNEKEYIALLMDLTEGDEMTKDNFERLKKSLKEAVAISKGEIEPARRTIFSPEDIAAIRANKRNEVKVVGITKNREDTGEISLKDIRKKLNLSQSDFAKLIQVNVRTLQNWEQGHRRPTGPAVALLKIVANSPQAALSALNH